MWVVRKTPGAVTAGSAGSGLSATLPTPSCCQPRDPYALGHPAYHSSSFSLHSDFLILPGFIDFIADEVVSACPLPQGGGWSLFKGGLWERLSLGVRCCLLPLLCKGIWLMGQRQLGCREMPRVWSGSLATGLEDAVSEEAGG